MLKIAAIGNNFAETRRFIEYKFDKKISSVNVVKGIYTLKNGDEVHLCYDETTRDKYESTEWDAVVVTPQYDTLLELLLRRACRPNRSDEVDAKS